MCRNTSTTKTAQTRNLKKNRFTCNTSYTMWMIWFSFCLPLCCMNNAWIRMSGCTCDTSCILFNSTVQKGIWSWCMKWSSSKGSLNQRNDLLVSAIHMFLTCLGFKSHWGRPTHCTVSWGSSWVNMAHYKQTVSQICQIDDQHRNMTDSCLTRLGNSNHDVSRAATSEEAAARYKSTESCGRVAKRQARIESLKAGDAGFTDAHFPI